jgi:hypothetical protein
VGGGGEGEIGRHIFEEVHEKITAASWMHLARTVILRQGYMSFSPLVLQFTEKDVDLSSANP